MRITECGSKELPGEHRGKYSAGYTGCPGEPRGDWHDRAEEPNSDGNEAGHGQQ
jgi:hypothetical protein